MGPELPSGHRLLPHTADVIVEAWGPTDLVCAQEAARALIEICAIGQPDPGSGSRVSRIGVAGGGLARAVLEEVVFALDTSELVPVSVHLQRAGGDEVKLRLGLADRESVQFTGAAPKAIVMLDSGSRHPDDLVRCRFIVDV